MIAAGKMRQKIEVYAPVDSVDVLGAPMRTWVLHASMHAAWENDSQSADESNNSPYEQATRSVTMVVRNSLTLDLRTNMRIVDVRTGAKYAITAIRYNQIRSECFIDCISGASDG